MEDVKEYLIAITLCSPLFFFIFAVMFRLLDNSAATFMDHDILVDSAYVSNRLIKEQMIETQDVSLKKSLRRSLLFRKLHNIFMVLAVISLVPVLVFGIVWFL